MRLCIGGAQISDNYGVSNKKSRINTNELYKIFELSKKYKIQNIDTAYSYKDSFNRISILNKKFKFKINMKIEVGDKISHQKKFFSRIEKIFSTLKEEKIYSIMIHDTKNFLKLKKNQKKNIIDKFNQLKKMDQIKKFGFSVYDENEIIKVNKFTNFDILQMPINIFDQRALNWKIINSLKKKKIEIHARSVFLQGILFLKECKINKLFKNIEKKKIISFFRKFPNKNMRILNSFNFVKNQKFIDKIIIGITSYEELKNNIYLFKKKIFYSDYKKFRIFDKKIIKPYLWKQSNK